MEQLESRRLLSTVSSFAGSYSLSAGANVNISKLSGNQIYADIAVDPIDPSRMFEISNGASGSMFTAYSTDAGVHWTPVSLITTEFNSDGSAAFDTFGNLFITYDDGVGTAAQDVILASSTDGGQTLSATQTIYSGIGDQPTVVTGPGLDGSGQSVWVTYGYTFDDPSLYEHWYVAARGAEVTGLGDVGTFSTPEDVPDPAHYENWGDIAIGPSGQVIITYQDPATTDGPDTIYTCLDDDGLGSDGFSDEVTATSTNVGADFSIPADPIHNIDAEAGLAWDTNPAHTDRLYLVYTDSPAVDSDNTNIFVRYSDNDGSTWSSPVPVNDDDDTDTTNSHFLPRIAIDYDTGYIGVGWYDCRNDNGDETSGYTDTTPNDETQFYVSASTNGGESFLANAEVSQGISNIGSDGGAYAAYGDYSGLAFVGGSLYPAWADDSNSTGDNGGPHPGAHFDVYTARVTLASSGGEALSVTGTCANSQIDLTFDPSGTYVEIWENNPDHTGRPTFTATAAAFTSSSTIDVNESGGSATMNVWGLPSYGSVSFDGTGGSGNTVNINGSSGNDSLVDAVSGVGYEISDSEQLITLTNVANRDFTGDGSSTLLLDGAGLSGHFYVQMLTSGDIEGESFEGGSNNFPVPTDISDVALVTISAAGTSAPLVVDVGDSLAYGLTVDGGSGAMEVRFTPSSSGEMPDTDINIVGSTDSDSNVVELLCSLDTINFAIYTDSIVVNSDCTIGFANITKIWFTQLTDGNDANVVIHMGEETGHDDTFSWVGDDTEDEWNWHIDSTSGERDMLFGFEDGDPGYNVTVIGAGETDTMYIGGKD